MHEPIIIEPESKAEAAIIWLHGLGADGNDFVPIVKALNEEIQRQVRFIFPHAPMRAVTINQGAKMRAWYDITDISLERKVDEKNILDSVKVVETLVQKQLENGLKSNQILLAGFSQGGVIALQTGLAYQLPLAGILALSTYLALPHRLTKKEREINQKIPIFIAHGSQDQVVPIALADRSSNFLMAHGYKPQTHTYAMQHAVCAEQLRDINFWLAQVLKIENLVED